MKKIISILLVIVMMLSIFSITVSADTHDQFPEVENKYYDKTLEYGLNFQPYVYREFHYYSDESNKEPDWALITCLQDYQPWMMKYGVFVKDRLIWNMAGYGIYTMPTGQVVYIPATDEFISLTEETVDQVIERCPNFVEELEKHNIGQKLGDVNEDNEIDILDATCIQRVLAELDWYFTEVQVYYDGIFRSKYISDVDGDGEETIMDATTIQQRVAGLE